MKLHENVLKPVRFSHLKRWRRMTALRKRCYDQTCVPKCLKDQVGDVLANAETSRSRFRIFECWVIMKPIIASISVGDVVILRNLGDSPEMLIVDADRNIVECMWFNANRDLVRAKFPPNMLRRVPDSHILSDRPRPDSGIMDAIQDSSHDLATV